MSTVVNVTDMLRKFLSSEEGTALLKAFFNSSDGQKFLSDHRRDISTFMKSPDGSKLLKSLVSDEMNAQSNQKGQITSADVTKQCHQALRDYSESRDFQTRISNLTSPASILTLLIQQIQSSNVVHNEAIRIVPSMVQKELDRITEIHVKNEAKRLVLTDLKINLPKVIQDAANSQFPELARTHCTQIVQSEIDHRAESQVRYEAKKLVLADLGINLPKFIQDTANGQLPELARTHSSQIIPGMVANEIERQFNVYISNHPHVQQILNNHLGALGSYLTNETNRILSELVKDPSYQDLQNLHLKATTDRVEGEFRDQMLKFEKDAKDQFEIQSHEMISSLRSGLSRCRRDRAELERQHGILQINLSKCHENHQELKKYFYGAVTLTGSILLGLIYYVARPIDIKFI